MYTETELKQMKARKAGRARGTRPEASSGAGVVPMSSFTLSFNLLSLLSHLIISP